MRISDWSSDVCSSDLVAVHRSNLQAGRAAARDGIGQVLTLADQRLERLALTAGPIEVHQREAWLRGQIFQPAYRHLPVPGAVAHKAQGRFHLLAGVDRKSTRLNSSH